jgi:epoxyqueuosine reductase
MKLDENFLASLGVVDYAYTEESKALHFDKYKEWLNHNHQGPLSYLEGDRGDKRQDIKLFWPEFQSAIVFLFSYKEIKKKLANENNLQQKIASYALGFDGFDYHHILKEKLNLLAKHFAQEKPDLHYQISLDVHPVLERDLALRAGLGWTGKNSMLLNRKEGSYFIIASLLFNQKFSLPVKKMETDHCGQCTKCVDACPTSAINGETRTLVVRDCISTFTIEQMKLDSVPSEKMNLSSGYIFGCDICQDVCPWNKKLLSSLSVNKVFTDMQSLILTYFCLPDVLAVKKQIEDISDRQFRKKFVETSFERGGRNTLLKNIYFYIQKAVN